jgi:hypothetical protein
LTDGASSEKYSLNKFFQLINQQFLHTIYQPKVPNDNGMFKSWKQKLIKNNVEILLDTSVITLNGNIDKVDSIKVSNNKNNNIYEILSDKLFIV